MKLPLWPIRLALRGVPNTVHTHMLGLGINHLLQEQYFSTRLQHLQGKRLWLTITDAGSTLRFLIQGCQFQKDRLQSKPDIHISGQLNDFLLLASRKEDPDTLFFARQLSMEGNTEDGLYLKNMLDALEFDTEAHFKAFMGEVAGIRLARLFRHLTSGDLSVSG